jgi:hypothetical protein
VFHKRTDLVDGFYGEWEICSYNATWRIISSGKRILCGSGDYVDDIAELDAMVKSLSLGGFRDIAMSSNFDVCIQLEGEVSIEFLGAFAEQDELLHIRLPDSNVAKYFIGEGWRVGKSNAPWA